ncbi:unnamed protein product [Symbiodinium natans]|uniref:Uncharacterized protein n=1 Tax=Symbiodinium natans TaxID=878477 RepID=A0A812KF02_9DINO|nr:unnamed protein product [Symbiodinium natans]
MQICINDFEVRYEDDKSGICGPYRIVGGFVVDSLQLRAVSAGLVGSHAIFEVSSLAPVAARPHSARGPGGTLTTLGRRWSNLFAEIVPLGRMEARIPWFADGEGLKVTGYMADFTEMFPHSAARCSEISADGIESSLSKHMPDSGCSVSDFLKTRKLLRKWERLRYGISRFVMQQMLDERQGPHAVHLSQHRLREKARRLRDIIGQHKYLAARVQGCASRRRFI